MPTPLYSPRFRASDADGNPLSGGKLYSYAAGTATPKATYTDSTGGAANANPVALDANGEANIWLSGVYKLRLESAASVVQPGWPIDNVSEFLTAPSGAFTLVNSAPTVTSATSFTLAGDQTALFFVNQRVKFTTTSTTVYSRVTTAVFSAGITTVTLASGAINVGAATGVYRGLGDAGLPIDSRQVAYGTASTVDAELLAAARLAVSQAFTAGQAVTPVALADGANIATNALLSNNFRVTLAGNRTLDNPTNMKDGQPLTWRLTQDATGSRLLSFGSKFKFCGSSVVSTVAGSVDMLSGVYWSDIGAIECVLNKAFI